METRGAELRPRIPKRCQRREEMAERSAINDQTDVAVDLASRFSEEDAGGPTASCGIAEDRPFRERVARR
jgi:hypothetical protein